MKNAIPMLIVNKLMMDDSTPIEERAAMQIVATAIHASVSENKIAHIDASDIDRAGITADDVCEELLAECEDSADADGICEYWGQDCDGNEWRVHVEVSQ